MRANCFNKERDLNYQPRVRKVDKMAGVTKAKFDFHRAGGEHETGPAAAYVQIYVKSSALGLRILQSQRTC
jgi:hypothetical protein